ncbi:hypothetical protein [Nocardia sp. alder85J]|uniref:hypothetical protein n=1 Tax=Nocardia sp. alder85J TaxID=2862949 RepID=UPI001CD2D2D6|nr:hypothetical protein [Nocardia sp. alder85J]MCX4098936.1 hypothetical protein [Nocardia sp. alder85J]
MDKALHYFDESRRMAESTAPKDSFDRIVCIAAFGAAMSYLVGVRIGGGEPIPAARLEYFRAEVLSRIDADQQGLTVYLFEAVKSVVIGDLDEALIRRSAIQLLLDDYPGVSDILDEYDREALAELDTELLEKAIYGDEVTDYTILHALPPTHWWWPFRARS